MVSAGVGESGKQEATEWSVIHPKGPHMDVITLLDDNHSRFHAAFKDLTCNVRRRLGIYTDV